ncbi:MAG: phosphopantetheine-binding protein [Deltaproteobacteria bacterium]|nr:phosphopantetheine-binding protein [Deltaproteobacteria bacterium]
MQETQTEKLQIEKLPVEKLIEELKKKVLDLLNIQDVRPETIDNNAPLVGNELGMDSIDILELVTVIEKDYGVRIDNKELGEKVFASFASLAHYIHDNSTLV